MSGNSPGGPELKTGGVGVPPSVMSGKEMAETETGSTPDPSRIIPETVSQICAQAPQPHPDNSANQMQPISVISDQSSTGPPKSGSEDMTRSSHVVQHTTHHPHLNQAHRIQVRLKIRWWETLMRNPFLIQIENHRIFIRDLGTPLPRQRATGVALQH